MKYKLKLESKHQIILQVSEANIIDVVKFLDVFQLHSEYLTEFGELLINVEGVWTVNHLRNVCEKSFEMVLVQSHKDCTEYLPIIENYIKENIG